MSANALKLRHSLLLFPRTSAPSGAEEGEIYYDSVIDALRMYRNGAWEDITTNAGGSGETNTASNVGTAGVGLFKQKTGVNLEFKKLNAASNKISISDDTPNSEVDVDVNQANLDLGLIGGSLALSQIDQDSATNGQVIQWTGSIWQPVTLALSSISGNLNLAQLAQNGATSNQVVQWNGSAWAPASLGLGSIGGSLSLSQIAQSGATTNQVPQWNGSAWVAATVASAPTIFGTRASPRLIQAAVGITAAASHMSTTALDQIIFIAGNAGAVELSANPQIEAHTVVGARMRLVGRNDTNTVKFFDNNGIEINGTATLGASYTIDLMWDGTKWIEVGAVMRDIGRL